MSSVSLARGLQPSLWVNDKGMWDMVATIGNLIKKNQGVASQDVVHAVRQASARTGADFSFLMAKAGAESSFNPAAKAKTSSATGLYQFIDSTWLSMVKKYGDKYGLGKYADQISMRGGKPCVTNCTAKKEILDLRKNPEISALMAGEFSNENKAYLECRVGCDVGGTELYMAHFMGAGGAAKFLNARAENGKAAAADMFPQAARANPNVFYDRATGRPRSLDEVYARFSKKFSDVDLPAQAPVPQMAEIDDVCDVDPASIARLASIMPADARVQGARQAMAHDAPAGIGFQNLSPQTILMLAQMQSLSPGDLLGGKSI